MKRRLFISQVAAGLSVYTLPTSLIANTIGGGPDIPSAVKSAPADGVRSFIQNGLPGPIQRVTILHVYSPAYTSLPQLLNMAKQAIERVNHVLGKELPTDIQKQFIDSPSSTFGTYAARFSEQGIRVEWLAIARVGRNVGKPTDKVHLYGSEGMLQMTNNGTDYQFVDFRKKIKQMEQPANGVVNYFNDRDFPVIRV